MRVACSLSAGSRCRSEADEVTSMIEGFGYAVIDLGDLESGGLMQQAGGRLLTPARISFFAACRWSKTFRSCLFVDVRRSVPRRRGASGAERGWR